MKLPDWLILWTWHSLIGEIYPEIRAIALGFDVKRNLVVRYYIDRKPTDDDFESVECVITNILAHTSSNDDIRSIQDEVIFTTDKIQDLNVLDGLVYARKEYV